MVYWFHCVVGRFLVEQTVLGKTALRNLSPIERRHPNLVIAESVSCAYRLVITVPTGNSNTVHQSVEGARRNSLFRSVLSLVC